MSEDHLRKSGVTELNYDVISGMPRPIVAETTCGQILENLKSLEQLENGSRYRQELHAIMEKIGSPHRIITLLPLDGAIYVTTIFVYFHPVEKRL